MFYFLARLHETTGRGKAVITALALVPRGIAVITAQAPAPALV